MTKTPQFNIVGGGLSGALLAVLLAQRGYEIDLFERHPDPRKQAPRAGRSINLALAARGIKALQAARVMDRVEPELIAMRGRMLHEPDSPARLIPYGTRPDEVIWSVSRAGLNRALIEAAASEPRVRLHFDSACLGVDTSANTMQLRDTRNGSAQSRPLGVTIATDGAGSVIRHSLVASGLLNAREDLLDHDYKEMHIPSVGGQPALDAHALHVWPRGGFMLIALPNPDRSFTATLFLSKSGSPSFATLRDAHSVEEFFTQYFPDTAALMPDQVAQFLAHPQAMLGTITCDRWHVDGRVLLLGDAAHAIVPFHGQGANCAFEDCLALAEQLDADDCAPADTAQLFADFQQRRRVNTLAIAKMALENYTEMRDSVRDERFQRLKTLALELERRHPTRFIPRYSMVMFHAEIPYSDALRRGAIQQQILDELDRKSGPAGSDYALAAQLIEAKLPALRSSTM